MRLLPEGVCIPADWVAPRDVFPWWLLLVHVPDRHPANGNGAHLGQLLAQRRHGGFEAEGRTGRAVHILSSSVPVGTPDDIACMLRDLVAEAGDDHPDPTRVIAALRGLSHLEFATPHGSVQRGQRFYEALRALSGDGKDDAQRAALNLVALHEAHEALGWVVEMVQSTDEVVALTAMGTLLHLGDAGRAALHRSRATSDKDTLRALEAVCGALEHNELDGLHRLLTSRNWAVRNASIKLLRDLVVAGASPEGPFEILMNRFKEDDDADNKATIGIAFTTVVGKLGPAAVEPLLHLATERSDDAHLIHDALLRAGAPGLALARLHALGSRSRGHRSSGRAELACCMGLHPSFPRFLSDWVRTPVVIAMQWTPWRPPQPVAEWFDNPGSVDTAELTSLMVRSCERHHDGSLAAAFVHARPDVIPAWERILVHLLNKGDENAWSTFSAVLGGAWHASAASPADLRCAVGFNAGPPMAPRPEYIGRLLAVASSSLEHSEEAMNLLGTMTHDARIIAAHLLSTLPKGISNLDGPDCAPAARGFGVLGKEVGVLGPNPRLLHGTQRLHPHILPFLGIKPVASREPGTLMDAVRTSAAVGDDWAATMAPWKDSGVVEGIVRALPLERVQAAAVAARLSSSRDMQGVADRIIQALGQLATQGELGVLLAPPVPQADAGPVDGGGAQTEDDDGELPDDLDLEALLRDMR